jgi:fructan beta-fructosidase
MKSFISSLLLVIVVSCSTSKQPSTGSSSLSEAHRPLLHFTPREKWMNDPNGMVYHNGTYHLFYQYYPDSTVWGPMHWGHAASKDMVHWEHLPVALYPDSLGYIFSGSAVVDVNNTSGFGREGEVPLVAIFTHHDPKGEKEGKADFQNQSIAYSLDEGKTWTKYAGNPVLRNPGVRDFRDPKVMWYEEGKKWIMTLATQDRVTFFSSPNLKSWKKESEFGKTVGAHGGVWECPDLFPLDHNGEKIWVLLVSINPGGPNGGSATQYFTGRFDGTTFTPFQTDTRWIDYGPDDYAGVTWANTGNRRIFLGWMSNWQYAQAVPTQTWRSAMTVPRELSLQKTGDSFLLLSKPVPELNVLAGKRTDATRELKGSIDGAARVDLTAKAANNFSLVLTNDDGQNVTLGYDHTSNLFYIDRTASGKVNFEKGFAAKHTAPRLSSKAEIDLTLIIDQASVELFANGGLTVMTQIFFPDHPFTNFSVTTSESNSITSLQYSKLTSIHKNPAGAKQ